MVVFLVSSTHSTGVTFFPFVQKLSLHASMPKRRLRLEPRARHSQESVQTKAHEKRVHSHFQERINNKNLNCVDAPSLPTMTFWQTKTIRERLSE
mmetsp:Transcript_29064/g.45740  ORF Transcript_29064/g.45740 Transcript_29064/m.45740 type:complete len:95 (+) Transcript_29064:157-441(+)